MNWRGAPKRKCSTTRITSSAVRLTISSFFSFYFSQHLHQKLWFEQHLNIIAEGKTNEELEAEEQEEEEEAINIQKRLAANLSEEDYDLNLFQVLLNSHLRYRKLHFDTT